MNRSSVAQYGGNTSPILATVDMEMNRRLSQQQQGNGNTANNTSNVAAVAAGPEPQKKREITQKDAIKILSKLRPVKRRTFLLNLISGLLSGYNWFGTYIWTYSTLSSYLDYTLVTQIDQGSLALYQVPGCSNYISNHEIQNTTYAQIRNYDSSCPYNFCVVNLQDCSLNTAYQYRFPTRFSDNTNPAQCNQRNLSALATVICTFTTLPGYTGTVSKSRSVCVFADPATTAYGVGSTVKLTEYFTNYAKVNSIDSQLEISCQMRDANSTDASNPFETTERSVNYLLLIILVSIVAGIIVIKELFKSTVLLMSLCYARFRQPGYFILTLDSPLIIPFCFSDFYLALMLASKRKARPARRVLMDFVFENGLKLFVTIFAILMTTGQVSQEALINLSSSILSAAYSVLEIFIGAAGFAADQTHKLAEEKRELEERLKHELGTN